MKQHDARFEALLLRARGQRRSRGAAMVEGLTVIPFLMMMFVGIMFVGGYYGEFIETLSEARFQTWDLAVAKNCDERPANGQLADMVIVDSADLGDLSQSPLAALCDKDFGSITYPARSSFLSTGPVTFEQNIEAVAFATCNESPIPGEVAYENAVEFLFTAYQDGGDIPPDANPPGAVAFQQILFPGGVGVFGGGQVFF